jgi:glycosyltransferase involved in cell wall biosynthesis
MKITLIITTYNWPEALLLVLKSIEGQSILPDEIIIADDGSKNETNELIISFQKKSNLNIIHSWQDDIGFRASRSRNKAILKSSGDYIILIDGDVILHPKFIQDHIINAEEGYFIQGCRALLSENITSKNLMNKNIYFSFFSTGIMNRKNTIHSFLLSKVFSNKHNNLRGIRSCNMSFYLKDCLNINGFNNEFNGWGREDSEFIVRLMNSGVSRKNIRFSAIQFHLWHNENTRAYIRQNNSILEAAINNRSQWCENGINIVEKNEN